MLRVNRTGMGVLLALCALGASVVGCENNNSSRTTQGGASTTTTRTTEGRTEGGATTRPVSTTRTAGLSSTSSMAFPTGDEGSSVIRINQSMPREVRAGQPFAYEIEVTNLTNTTLQNVAVISEESNNLEFISSEPAFSRGEGRGGRWNIGNLAPRESRVIRTQARAGAVGTAQNCLSVAYNNTICVATNVVQPALQLTKGATAEATPCDPITLRYEVRNNGTGTATGVRIRDTLPQGLTTQDGRNTIDQDVGSLEAGQSRVVTVTARAARTGRYESPAQAQAEGGLTAQTGPVATVVRQAALTIEADCTERAFVGRDVTYTFNVTNTGDAPATGAFVTATLPQGATLVRTSEGGGAAGGGVRWDVGTLAPRQSRSVSMTVRPAGIGTISSQATANAACAANAPATATCQTNISGIPAILLEVIDNNDPIEVGGEVTYVIAVTNQGSADGTNIRIVCELPGQQAFVSAVGATNGTAQGRTVTFAPLPRLAPKARAEFRVTVRATEAGDVRFRTTMQSDQIGAPVEETEATNLYR